MVAIICLIIGILGFVKRRISVTKRRELRGAPMYIVSALLCLPLPLSFLAGAILGASSVASGKPIDQSGVMIAAAVCTWVPIVGALVLGFALAKPKEVPAEPSGFPVLPPQQPAGTQPKQ